MRRAANTLLLAVVLSLPSLDAASQDASDEIVDIVREAFQDAGLAELFQGISLLGIAPGINSANYTIDEDDPDFSDTDIKTIKIPVRHEFDSGAFCIVESTNKGQSDYQLAWLGQSPSSGALCMKPYAELSLSYVNAEQTIDISGLDSPFTYDFTTLSALAGVGLSIPLSKKTTFRPMLLGGYSHLSSDADFDGALAAEFREGLDGILDDAKFDAVLLGAAAELRHQHLFDNKIELQGRLRYNYLVNNVFAASDETFEEANDFVVVTGSLEASVPTGLQLFSRDLYALGFGGSNLLLTEAVEKINSEDFVHEIGGGLELRNPPLIKSIRLSASVFFGEELSGYRAGVGFKF